MRSGLIAKRLREIVSTARKRCRPNGRTILRRIPRKPASSRASRSTPHAAELTKTFARYLSKSSRIRALTTAMFSAGKRNQSGSAFRRTGRFINPPFTVADTKFEWTVYLHEVPAGQQDWSVPR